jgi:Leucine-rich repeat (LRR) protein
MKKNKLMTLLGLLLCIYSCSDEINNDEDSTSGSNNNNLKKGQVEIKVKIYSEQLGFYRGYYGFEAAAKKIAIDWGDGYKLEEITLNGEYRRFTHGYSDYDFQTILINSENLTSIDIGNVYEFRSGDCPDLNELFIYDNHLTVLDIKKAGALSKLNCRANQLTELNVNGLTALQRLFCSSNKLTELNVNKCTALILMECHNNQLTELNVSGCTALSEIFCSSNKLTELNLSGCTALSEIDCHDNKLTELNVSGCTALSYIYCGSNQLTELNVNGCTALNSINCRSNQLTAKKLNDVFESLPVIINLYSHIDIGDNPGTSTCNRSIAESKGWKIYD